MNAELLCTPLEPMPPLTRPPASVLLVDRDPDTARQLEAALMPFQMDMDAVSSGAEALDRAQHSGYDLLVLDLGLEEWHGWDVLRRLKAHPKFRHVKVLVTTANANTEALARSFGHGADDFVMKPFDLEELGMRAFRLLH